MDDILGAATEFREPWGLHIDIRNFFDTVPERLIVSTLRDTPCDTAATETAIRSLLAPLAGVTGPVVREEGIPQGSPLSPVMSNAVLLPFDTAFAAGGSRLFRYADDMLFLCRDEKDARDTLDKAGHHLSLLGLEVNSSKTRISPLAGATFLGFGFGVANGGWIRSIPDGTWSSCSAHLARMEDSARSPSEMAAFLNQWCAYFLPAPEDRKHHSSELEKLADRFRLPAPEPARRRNSAPGGFSYDGQSHAKSRKGSGRPFERSRWALWYMLKRCHVGLTFRRKGLLPVPSGVRICVCGHNIFFRL